MANEHFPSALIDKSTSTLIDLKMVSSQRVVSVTLPLMNKLETELQDLKIQKLEYQLELMKQVNKKLMMDIYLLRSKLEMFEHSQVRGMMKSDVSSTVSSSTKANYSRLETSELEHQDISLGNVLNSTADYISSDTDSTETTALYTNCSVTKPSRSSLGNVLNSTADYISSDANSTETTALDANCSVTKPSRSSLGNVLNSTADYISSDANSTETTALYTNCPVTKPSHSDLQIIRELIINDLDVFVKQKSVTCKTLTTKGDTDALVQEADKINRKELSSLTKRRESFCWRCFRTGHSGVQCKETVSIRGRNICETCDSVGHHTRDCCI